MSLDWLSGCIQGGRVLVSLIEEGGLFSLAVFREV